MSVFRRLLLIAKLTEDTGGSIILDFTDGVLTLNDDGRGNKITVSGTEVTINEQ